MSGHVVSIDTLEHASAVLQGLRRKASAANRYGGPLVTLNQFDDVVQRAERDLSERRKQEQRMESLISQDPPLRQSHATSRVVGNSKDLDTPLEASPEKERELRGRGGVRRSNNVDFSSDEDDDDDFGGGGMTAAQKLERVALNRPRRAPSSPPHSPRSPNSNSFYDEEETLGDSDDDDNAALFSGFTAPINSDSVFATTATSSSAAQRHSSSMSVASVASSASSLPAASVVAAAAAASGVRVPVRPPAVPSSQTTKDLNARGVVVGKGGIFIRAGGRKKKGSD